MVSRALDTTRNQELTPLGASGQRNFDAVRREALAFGEGHARLFSEPYQSDDRGVIDWYADEALQGRPQRLVDLAPEDRAPLEARLGAMVTDLLNAAERLEASGGDDGRRRALALRNAVEVPDERNVWIIDGQPVLTAWAHRAKGADAPSRVLQKRFAPLIQTAAPGLPPSEAQGAPAGPEAAPFAPGPATAPQASETVYVTQILVQEQREHGPFTWLWWLLWAVVGLTAALIALLLLPACGLNGIGILNTCPDEQAGRNLALEESRRSGLEAQLALLERRLRSADMACQPEQPIEEVCLPGETRVASSDLMFLIDASTSMDFGMNAPREALDEVNRLTRLHATNGGLTLVQSARQRQLFSLMQEQRFGPSRMEYTKRALAAALRTAGVSTARVGSFNTCERLNLGPRVSDPEALARQIDSINTSSYTALAHAIRTAAEAMEGGRTAQDPAKIVLISDGRDTCGGDPCAAARAAKQSRPGLRIDVVDLVGLPELRCVAEITGGEYLVRPEEISEGFVSGLAGRALSGETVCVPTPVPAAAPDPEPQAEPEPEPQPEPETEDFDNRVEDASGRTDAVFRVTLAWDTRSDLDLSVRCPSGAQASFSALNACGGSLDVDYIPATRTGVVRPVENFVADAPAAGVWRITVTNFKSLASSNPFQLLIVSGDERIVRRGTLSRTGQTQVFTFTR